MSIALARTAGFLTLPKAQVAPANKPGPVTFHSIAELTRQPGAQVTLRGARLASPKDWPASFYSVVPDGSCTSTLVGSRALLTAAHCVPDNGSAVIRKGGLNYSGTCSHSDLYHQGDREAWSTDWAMCLMESPVTVSQYETINSDPTRIQINTELLLTGFGCTKASGGGADGHYRIGEAPVTGLPTDASNDIVTEGDVSLCFGDSGGGAFLFLDPGKTKRVQVSVNSRAGTDENGKLSKVSKLSSLSTPQAQSFLKAWASKNGVDVCGVTPGTNKCRF
jgi:hypothetical protein